MKTPWAFTRKDYSRILFKKKKQFKQTKQFETIKLYFYLYKKHNYSHLPHVLIILCVYFCITEEKGQTVFVGGCPNMWLMIIQEKQTIFFKLSKKYYLDNSMLSLTYERWLSQKQRVVGAPEGSSGMSAGRCSHLHGVKPQPHCGLPLWLLQPPPHPPPTPNTLTRRHTGGRSQHERESVLTVGKLLLRDAASSPSCRSASLVGLYCRHPHLSAQSLHLVFWWGGGRWGVVSVGSELALPFKRVRRCEN